MPANSVFAVMNAWTESVQYPALCCIELILQIDLSVAREHFLMNAFYYC